jgi:hypothetical protein
MSLSKAPVWGLLTLLSFVAVMLLTWFSLVPVIARGPALLADASRAGRRAGLLVLAYLIPGSALSRRLPAAASQSNHVPEHTKASPGSGRSGRRMTVPILPALRALSAAAGLPSGIASPVLPRLEAAYGWIISRGEDIDSKDESRTGRRFRQLAAERAERARAALASAALTLASRGLLYARPAPGQAPAGRLAVQLGWAG